PDSGRNPRPPARAARERDHRARGEGRDADDRRALRHLEGGARRVLRLRGRRSRRRDRARLAGPGRPPRRRDRDSPERDLLVTTLEQVFRDEWGRVLASLIGFLGDFDLAEEAAQEAFAIAAQRWPGAGLSLLHVACTAGIACKSVRESRLCTVDAG